MNQIIIVGNTSEFYHLGAILIRASKILNIDIIESDNNTVKYAPSMSSVLGKGFFRIAKKRPFEWWKFNRNLINQIQEHRPNLVLVTGIFPLTQEVFVTCNSLKIPIVNYLTDSPWSPQNYHEIFQMNLSNYDLILSTKKDLVPDLIMNGCKQVKFLPFAYDPMYHYLPDQSNSNLEGEPNLADVCLVGGADRDRINFVKDFLADYKGSLKLYGAYWDRERILRNFCKGTIFGEEFRQTIYGSKLNLGVVRRANKDGHSMRSYEIPACGGIGIYEDTSEHRDLFKDYPDYGFFTSPTDLAEKCNWLIQHPVERENMRQLGIQTIMSGSNTYSDRIKTILEWAIPCVKL